jgi:hypothetical protein
MIVKDGIMDEPVSSWVEASHEQLDCVGIEPSLRHDLFSLISSTQSIRLNALYYFDWSISVIPSESRDILRGGTDHFAIIAERRKNHLSLSTFNAC